MAARKRGRPRKHKDIEHLTQEEYCAIAHERRHRGSFESKLKWMVYGAKKRAKGRFECTIKTEHFFPRTHCPGLPWIEFEFHNSREKKDSSPSIDRLDPTKGYTPENCWIVSYRVNRLKGDATLEELEEICRNWRAELVRRGLLKQ